MLRVVYFAYDKEVTWHEKEGEGKRGVKREGEAEGYGEGEGREKEREKIRER